MKSNWELAQEKSNYHFDPTVTDISSYAIHHLGCVATTWNKDLRDIVANAKPATWATRGYKGKDLAGPTSDLAAEELDLERAGIPTDMIITHLNWDIPDSLQQLSDEFGLKDCMNRIHVQLPGELWNLHIDKLDKWAPDQPDSVMRIFIALTDWQMGQFYQFGNYNWSQWRAGDVITFDWQNMPHSTANAGYHPRVTFQITGIKTDKTQEMINRLHNDIRRY